MKVIKNLITRNFWVGRPQWSGSPFVVVHTYGGKGTNLYNWFQTNNVSVSSHFSIEKDGTIRQYVELDNTAYANGTAWSNSNGVSVEFQDDNDYNNPNTYTQAQFDAFGWLFTEIINPWAGGKIANNEHGITPHNKWTPKECPGKLWDRREELFKSVNNYTKNMDELTVIPAKIPNIGDCLRRAGISDPGSDGQKQNCANLNKTWLDKNGVVKSHSGTWQNMESKMAVGDLIRVRGNPSDPTPIAPPLPPTNDPDGQKWRDLSKLQKDLERRLLEVEIELDVTKNALQSAHKIISDQSTVEHVLRNEIAELKKKPTFKEKLSKLKNKLLNLIPILE